MTGMSNIEAGKASYYSANTGEPSTQSSSPRASSNKPMHTFNGRSICPEENNGVPLAKAFFPYASHSFYAAQTPESKHVLVSHLTGDATFKRDGPRFVWRLNLDESKLEQKAHTKSLLHGMKKSRIHETAQGS